MTNSNNNQTDENRSFPCDGCGTVVHLDKMTGIKSRGIFGACLCVDCLKSE